MQKINEDITDIRDTDKVRQLEKTVNKYGYTFSKFSVNSIRGNGSLHIELAKLGNRMLAEYIPDVVNIGSPEQPSFAVKPATFTTVVPQSRIKEIIKSLENAAKLVDILNKVDYSEYI